MGKVYQFKTATDGIIDVASQIAAGLITGAKLENDIELPSGSTVAGVAIATQDQIDIINQGMLPHAAVQTVLTKANVSNLGGSAAWTSTSGGTITLTTASINDVSGTDDAPTLIADDRVLLRFTDTAAGTGSAWYSGIYRVSGITGGSTTLVRAEDFNAVADLVLGAYVNVVGTNGGNSPDLNNAYFLQSSGTGDLNAETRIPVFALWGTNTVTLSAGQGIVIASSVVSADIAAPLSFDSNAIALDFADPLYFASPNLALYAADGEGQDGYMSSADFNKLAAMGDSITQTDPESPLTTINTSTAVFPLPNQETGTVAVYQIRLLAKCTEGYFIAQTIEFATARAGGGGGVVVQLDSNPSGTVVTEYHSNNNFKDLNADFQSSNSNDGDAHLLITGLNGHTTTYTVTCVRQVY